jgi:hypothetical protein
MSEGQGTGDDTQMTEISEGYYWIKHRDNTTFVAFMHKGQWWIPGIETPVIITYSQILEKLTVPRIH